MLTNCDNFRDMGGIKTHDGHVLKEKKIIRSGKLSDLNDDDVVFLEKYGLKHDVDFRSMSERKNEPDRIPASVSYHFAPVFPVDETRSGNDKWESRRNYYVDEQAAFKDMLDAYNDIVLQDCAKKAYREFFDVLLANDKDDESVLFHCSAGKDRTGMGAVYLLTVLGVDETVIRADYLASNKYLRGQQKIEDVRALQKGEIFAKNIFNLGSVSEHYLDCALGTMAREYGSLGEYLEKELKLSANEQEDLRKIYLK